MSYKVHIIDKVVDSVLMIKYMCEQPQKIRRNMSGRTAFPERYEIESSFKRQICKEFYPEQKSSYKILRYLQL